MTEDEKILLNRLEQAISGNTWDEFQTNPAITSLCIKHKIEALLCTGGLSEGLLPPLFQQAAEQSVLQFWHLFTRTKQICTLLEDHGIRCAVLKGVSIARDYPVMEYRKSGDIDVLIHPDDLILAEKALLEEGCIKQEEEKVLHHCSFRGTDKIDIEVHTMFAEPFDNEETNQKLKNYAADALLHTTAEPIESVVFPFLSEPYQALSLCLHMLQHYLRAGFGLKLLADWSVFWNKHDTPELRNEYRMYTDDLGITGFSDLISSCCVYSLGMKPEHHPGELMDRELADLFLDEVMKGGEFGHSSAERMVSMRGSHVTDFLREFHHQMSLNYPEKSKNRLLWPGLWSMTLVRFLRNNRKIRHVSLKQVLVSARDRSRLNESMHLFSENNQKK